MFFCFLLLQNILHYLNQAVNFLIHIFLEAVIYISSNFADVVTNPLQRLPCTLESQP